MTARVPVAAGTGTRAAFMKTGIGLRGVHHADILSSNPDVGFLEAHSENYFARGGSQREALLRIRERYPLSLHGVGLSLGSTDPLDATHLDHLARLIRDFDPLLVSEHLCWSSVGGRFANDLLPLPYTEEALRHVSARVREVQERLERPLLIENVSSYLQFARPDMTEWEFLAALAANTGCGLLLDVNNIYVSARNHEFDAQLFLRGIPETAVREIHLAGHSVHEQEGRTLRIDTHSTPVCDAVWDLYRDAVARFGPAPTLIEWDQDIPALEVLVAEAHKADRIAEAHHAVAA